MGKSSDHLGKAAVVVYVDEASQPEIPSTIESVRTLVIPTSAHAVAFGTAPLTNSSSGTQSLSAAALTQALAIKRQTAHKLLQRNPAFFGVGVGQSLDNPREAALVIYVDRRRIPAQLPSVIENLRIRYIVMDRLHVTRSYAAAFESRRHCLPHPQDGGFDPASLTRPRNLNLF